MSKKNTFNSFIKYSSIFFGSIIAYNLIERDRASEYASKAEGDDIYRYYNGRFGKLAYIKRGNGTPLLLIHNLSTESSSCEWNKSIDYLANNFSVFAIDLPGCGKSDKNQTAYTNYMYALAINDFIKNRMSHLSNKVNVAVYGDSVPLVLTAMALDNDIFDNVFLINPPALNDNGNLTPYASRKICPLSLPFQSSGKLLPDFLRHFINMPVVGTFVYNLLFSQDSILSSITANGTLKQKDCIPLSKAYYYNSHNGQGSKYLFSSQLGNLLYVDCQKMLERTNNKIYLIYGKDLSNSGAIVSEYTSQKNEITAFPIEGCDIFPQLKNPKDVSEIINICSH